MKTETKYSIIEVAYQLFSEHGFSATSIKMIASNLNIPTSLIFHHFASKENLWVSTEAFAIEQAYSKVPTFREDTLENFLNDIIGYRLKLYENKKFRRLFQWRSLETNARGLMNVAKDTNLMNNEIMNIPQLIKRLQNSGLIRDDIDHCVIAMIIFSQSSYAIFDYIDYYNIENETIEAFKAITLNSMMLAFAPNSNKNNAE